MIEIPSWIDLDLTSDKVAELPTRLRMQISEAYGSTDAKLHGWFLASKTIEEPLQLFDWFAGLPLSPDESDAQLTESEKNIEKLLDVMCSAARRPPIETVIEVNSASLRAEYLNETQFFCEDKKASLFIWELQHKVFAVRRSGVDLYPDFQFEGGVPRPAIERILAELPNDMTGWQIAMWFASGNGWLDGAMPQECLSDLDAVVYAAQQFAHPAVG